MDELERWKVTARMKDGKPKGYMIGGRVGKDHCWVFASEAEELISRKNDALVTLAQQLAQSGMEITRLTAENATLKEQRDEFERKGKELCTAYGNALITIYDLKKRAEAAAQKGGTQ